MFVKSSLGLSKLDPGMFPRRTTQAGLEKSLLGCCLLACRVPPNTHTPTLQLPLTVRERGKERLQATEIAGR